MPPVWASLTKEPGQNSPPIPFLSAFRPGRHLKRISSPLLEAEMACRMAHQLLCTGNETSEENWFQGGKWPLFMTLTGRENAGFILDLDRTFVSCKEAVYV